MRWLVVLLVAFLGCEQSPEERSDIVCTTFCDCVEGTTLPAVVQSCITANCLPTLPPVSDACLDCVYARESSCPNLVDDCTTECLQPEQGGP